MRKLSYTLGSAQRPGASKSSQSETSNRRYQGSLYGHFPSSSRSQQQLCDSDKKSGSSRFKRISTEGLTRLSLLSNRLATPIRSNVDSNLLGVPSSSARLSTDSSCSGWGKKNQKDTRPIGDPAFKKQCVDLLLEFLLSRGYEFRIDRRVLSNPTSKDFVNIFNFVYQGLHHPNFALPSRFEDELPRLLKLIGYPVQMSKSSFTSVGSPHTWPSVLAMLSWMAILVKHYEEVKPAAVAYPCDFSDDVNEGYTNLTTIVKMFHERDPDRHEYILEEYRHILEESKKLQSSYMDELLEKEKKYDEKIEQLTIGQDRLEQRKQDLSALKEDKEKLFKYVEKLENHISSKEVDLCSFNSQLDSAKDKQKQLHQQISELEQLRDKQSLSPKDLVHYKNHANEFASVIAQLQEENKQVSENVWEAEMSLAKAQENVTRAISSFNIQRRHLQLGEDYEISSMNLEEQMQSWEIFLVSELEPLRKQRKQALLKKENEKTGKVKEVKMLEEKIHQQKEKIQKLERQLARVKDDIACTREEFQCQNQAMLSETERLHKKVMVARKGLNCPYEKTLELARAKERLEEIQVEVSEKRKAGTEALMAVFVSVLKDAKVIEQEIDKSVALGHSVLKTLKENRKKIMEG